MVVFSTVFETTISLNAGMGPILATASTDVSLPSSSNLPLDSPLPTTSISPTTAIVPAISTSLHVYSTGLTTLSTPSPNKQSTNALPTQTPALSTYTTSQEHNASASPSFLQNPPGASSSTSSDSAVVIGSSVGAAVLLFSIAVITLFFRLRSRRRKLNARVRHHPLDRTQPTVSPMDRNHNSGVWGGQCGYDGENRPPSGSSDGVTVVGAGDVDSLSEISDMLQRQETLGVTASPSVVDIRPEEDRSWIARRERSRELKKLYPA
ncbi:hypothetical protein EDD17DRAFT_1591078 [Pisolithus thermaeus]|nr:hypothetical protein EV401DRAFT_156073 [Pisolithus croceorrhizus]KAI6161261.1 hypothetical protein EDD17DRAFT_1591078 [Pisolithus thermaeus]